jgi:hypothetical protein
MRFKLAVDTVVFFIEDDVGTFDSTTVDASLTIPESSYLCGIVDVSQDNAWFRSLAELSVPLFFRHVLVHNETKPFEMLQLWWNSAECLVPCHVLLT